MKEQWNYNELCAHYLAVRKRLGGLGKSAGLVPITKTPMLEVKKEEVSETVWEVEAPEQVWTVPDLPRNNFTRLLMQVAKKHNVDPNIIVSHNRNKNIVAVRRELVYGAHKELKYSQLQIARWLKRDHKSINHDIYMWEHKHNVSA